MSALTFAVLALVGIKFADSADNAFGRVVFHIAAVALFTCGFLLAPWSEVLA